jgi:light-regulated signal transduction histidine kinase (bacteriophytochrome)
MRDALSGISLKSKIALGIAGAIMFVFFMVQTCVVLGWCPPNYELAKFGYGCVIGFMPPFFVFVSEFLLQKRRMIEEIDTQVGEVRKQNTYLEHAAKILRHDMHSGINTYIPRGISSLERRMPQTVIDELKLHAPLKMLKEGLTHSQKVYKGVYEFTNLVKKDAVLERADHNLKTILENYLTSTSYKSQVDIAELPVVSVNESLFCTALDNLIRNGLKYNDSDSKMVKIYMEGDLLILQDNGRGITQQEFDTLSRPYTRKAGQKETGTGLGLNICIAILNEHGFSISCEKNDIGTKMKIRLK